MVAWVRSVGHSVGVWDCLGRMSGDRPRPQQHRLGLGRSQGALLVNLPRLLEPHPRASLQCLRANSHT